MARPIYQYKPINDTPDQAIGILIPLNKGSQGKSATSDYAVGSESGLGVFESSYTTKQAVITNLKNLILTQKGERFMQPNFGTDIRKVLFENNTEDVRDMLVNTIDEDIKFWLPYVKLQGLEAIPSEDMHTLNIQLNFQITNIGANVVINIMASENAFEVSEVSEEEVFVQTGTFGRDTAFSAGDY